MEKEVRKKTLKKTQEMLRKNVWEKRKKSFFLKE